MENNSSIIVPDMYTEKEHVAQIAHAQFNTYKESIEKYWSDKGNPLPESLCNKDKPCAFLTRHVAVANQESLRFLEMSIELGLIPIWSQYLEDKFVTASARKTKLLHPRNSQGQREKLVRDPNVFNGKKLNEIFININGDTIRMIDYHNQLWKEKIQSRNKLAECNDMSTWLKWFGTAKDYYFGEMTLLLGHGIMFKDFHSGINSQSHKTGFTDNIVMPAFEKVKQEFGVKPMIYRFEQETSFPYMLD